MPHCTGRTNSFRCTSGLDIGEGRINPAFCESENKMAQFRRRCTRKVRDLLHTLFKRLGVQAPQLVESFLERGKVDKCASLIHLLLLIPYVPPLSRQRLRFGGREDQKGVHG